MSIPETIDDIPNVCGEEQAVADAVQRGAEKALPRTDRSFDFGSVKSVFACALHMQQPLIPAGGDDLQTADLISNLQYMMEHPDIGDNHNASVFHWCYKRMGEIIPELAGEGLAPRIMLDYSGCLFHGLRKMGLDDVFDTLKRITCDPELTDCAEWLGAPWGHAVAPSTPVQDYRLHVKAWQQHFAAIFGFEALERVRGFSPSEMALPNDPDVAYEWVNTLTDCGFQWVMVQEHTVEQPENGHGPEQRHLPHRLQCRNADGETAEILALIKTQGSDTKLVAQMQPYYEAKGLDRIDWNGHSIPPIVTQIADGENGGVMMNEFPPKYKEAIRECSHSDTRMVNGSEYLEQLFAAGITRDQLPALQPVQQKKIWDRVPPGCGREKLDAAIEELKNEDHQFHMEGGSWTDNISWVKGYDDVLGPMERASSLFNEKVLKAGWSMDDARVRQALFLLMTSQTSCYRYWGEGVWTDYGREICRRAEAVLSDS